MSMSDFSAGRGFFGSRWWIVAASFSALLVGSGVVNIFASGMFLVPITTQLGITPLSSKQPRSPRSSTGSGSISPTLARAPAWLSEGRFSCAGVCAALAAEQYRLHNVGGSGGQC